MDLSGDNVFCSTVTHAVCVMKRIQEHLCHQQLCDVTIIVGSQRFAAHRLVLSSVSDYFRAMFNNDVREAVEKEIAIHGVEPDIFLSLMNFIYRGKIQITEENVEKIMSAANMLQLSSVVEAACEFLVKQLHPSNCLGIRSFADLQNNQFLYKAAQDYTMNNFRDVIKNQEFLLLTPKQVCDLLSSDDVDVKSEKEIFQAMMLWVQYSKADRISLLPELLSHIRLIHLPKEYIIDTVQTNPLIQDSLQCEHQVINALMHHLLPNRHPAVCQPRHSTLGLLYAIGGMDNSKGSTSVECYDKRLDRWTHVANMTGRRLQFGVAVIDDKLYVVGGRDGLKTLNSVECFDSKTKLWNSMPPVATHRHGLGVAVLNGPMYAVGGHDGWSYLSTVERWDPQARVWNYVAPMSVARSTVGVAVLLDKLFAVGGRDGSSCLRSVECFDPHTNKWTNCAPMSKRRGGVGVGVCGTHLYAIGGHDAPASNQMSKLSESVERYDPKIDQWTTVSSMSVPRDAVGISVLGGRLYACGGYDGQSYLSTCESYDPESNEWNSIGSLNTGRAGAVVVRIPNRM